MTSATVLHTYPAPEPLCVGVLKAGLADAGENVTCSTGVPPGWRPTSRPHVQVISDGTPRMTHPIAVYPTIRLVGRAASSSEAQRLAALAQTILTAHSGGPIARVRPLTGVLPARDPETDHELAMTTCQVTVRSQPVT